MSRKDFQFIAETIGAMQLDAGSRHIVAQEFARKLGATNPRFDFNRFVTECQRQIDKVGAR